MRNVRKFLSLLLCCILVMGVPPAQVFAEEVTVTLDLGHGDIDISPTGYSQGGGAEVPHTGPYIITGTRYSDTPLEFINNTGSPVTFDVTWDNVTMGADTWCTVIRFSGNSDIALNLRNQGTSTIESYNHPVFSKQGSATFAVNITNPVGSTLKMERWYPGTPVIYDVASATINGAPLNNNQPFDSSISCGVHQYGTLLGTQVSPATCTQAAKYTLRCSYCQEENNNEFTYYGEKDASNHTGNVGWTTQNGTQHESKYSCCSAVVVGLEDHEWTNGVCGECGYTCSHTGGTATCLEQAECTVCGQLYGEKNVNNHTGNVSWTTQSGTQHESKYSCCGAVVVAQENHEWENSVCKECAYACVHVYGDWTVTKEATVEEEGSREKVCVCGHKVVERIETLLPDDVPKTGDGSNLALLSGLVVISLSAMAAVLVWDRKRMKA